MPRSSLACIATLAILGAACGDTVDVVLESAPQSASTLGTATPGTVAWGDTGLEWRLVETGEPLPTDRMSAGGRLFGRTDNWLADSADGVTWTELTVPTDIEHIVELFDYAAVGETVAAIFNAEERPNDCERAGPLGLVVAVSRDAGQTWTSHPISRQPGPDRFRRWLGESLVATDGSTIVFTEFENRALHVDCILSQAGYPLGETEIAGWTAEGVDIYDSAESSSDDEAIARHHDWEDLGLSATEADATGTEPGGGAPVLARIGADGQVERLTVTSGFVQALIGNEDGVLASVHQMGTTVIASTIDGGSNWTVEQAPGRLSGSDELLIYLDAGSPAFASSDDLGETWHRIGAAPGVIPLDSIAVGATTVELGLSPVSFEPVLSVLTDDGWTTDRVNAAGGPLLTASDLVAYNGEIHLIVDGTKALIGRP